MCLAAGPGLWDVILRFAIGCGRKTSRDRPNGSEAILRAALQAVRPGGQIIYSTCSLEPEENQQVVAAVLSESRNSRQISLESRIEELRDDGILTQIGR